MKHASEYFIKKYFWHIPCLVKKAKAYSMLGKESKK